MLSDYSIFVKFILNTAIDPHFCALFDTAGIRIAYHEWENRRHDGKELWEFLKNYDVSNITFLGGVSGPGGFSSLRAGAGVLNSLAFATGISVHSLRADFWQEALLEKKGEVVLNSFGDGVWIQKNSVLHRYSVEEAGDLFLKKPACVSWLPKEKQEVFSHPIFIDMKQAPEVLLHLLEKVEPHNQCVTEYEVPPV